MASIARFAASLEKVTGGKPWQPYALAFISVFIALLLREVLVVVLGINLFAILFLPAVIITGLACGLLPGIFAAVLATFVPFIHLVANSNQFFPSSANMLMNTAVIGGLNLFLALVAASHWEHRKQIELTMSELNHRTKNLLSVISSIAHHIARGTNDIDSFREALDKRLRSMAAAHDLLLKNEWKDTALRSVVTLAIAPFVKRNQIAMEGPDILVSAVTVENIMMALHELLTNSAKYGALSLPNGTIKVRWQYRIQEQRLRFVWEGIASKYEKPISRRGFGTLVLTEIVPKNLKGQATYEIKDGRVLWALDIPLKSVVPAEGTGILSVSPESQAAL
jgi:two-component sensor histidine kinase